MIQKISPSFTSKVYIANYYEMKKEQLSVINSNKFLNEIKKLEKNGNNDTVVFTPDTDPICSGIFMTLSRKDGNKKLTVSREFDYSYEIPQNYKEMNQVLGKNLYSTEVVGNIAKYIV